MTAYCFNCHHYLKDTIGFGQGIGQCQKYQDLKANGATEEQLKIAFKSLGNQLFYGNTSLKQPRYCTKYQAINPIQTQQPNNDPEEPIKTKLDPDTLLPHQKQLLWRGIKRDNPALAELLTTDQTIKQLKNLFDAKIIFTEEDAFSYMATNEIVKDIT